MPCNVVDLAGIYRTRWLLRLRAQAEAVEIDVAIWHIRVALVRLYYAEVAGATTVEAVISIQAEDRGFQQIIWNNASLTTIRLQRITEVEPLMVPLHSCLLDNPHELLTAVIEDQWYAGVRYTGGHCLRRYDLKLFDQILVLPCGKEFAIALVQEDVVAEELYPGGLYVIRRCTGETRVGPPEIREGAQMEDDAYGMCLECDEGQRETHVVTEPEPERDL